MGEAMGNVLKDDAMVANMPKIRVVPKKINKKKRNNMGDFAS